VDNIPYAEAVLVVAEKAADTQLTMPNADNYRPAEEWELYAD
jgi:hypothetical protein